MSTGLIALFDDIAALAKVAAASLDDVAGQAAQASVKAGGKAVGVVIDDATVTPAYVHGFSASRELPIVGKIAAGSVRNKLLYLLPPALVLSWAAPWAITPILMLGGAYLCMEGAEKVHGAVFGHDAAHGGETAPAVRDGSLEDAKVKGAIQTDLILSAEIMAVTLGSVEGSPIWLQAGVLALVGLGITALVYGVVALIVKADDMGLAMARQDRPMAWLLRGPAGQASWADRLVRPVTRGAGTILVRGMPVLLHVLGIVGTAAMVWVGGGILLHGSERVGLAQPGQTLDGWSGAAEVEFGPVAAWVVEAAGSGVVGLVVGAVLLAAVQGVVRPVLRRLRRR